MFGVIYFFGILGIKIVVIVFLGIFIFMVVCLCIVIWIYKLIIDFRRIYSIDDGSYGLISFSGILILFFIKLFSSVCRISVFSVILLFVIGIFFVSCFFF